ncbi:MAG: transposase [Myxococcales bacterium]|nr:transposase [Myxococcales bacterium]
MANGKVEKQVVERNIVQALLQSRDFQSMLSETLRTVMESEVEAVCGAPYASRSEDRSNRRNGYRPRAPQYPAGCATTTSWLVLERVRRDWDVAPWANGKEGWARRAFDAIFVTSVWPSGNTGSCGT